MNFEKHPAMSYDEKIAQRLARRAIKASKKGKTEIDVKGFFNLKRKYKKLPFFNGSSQPGQPVYDNHIYQKVNEILSYDGLTIERKIGKISYWGFGCYVFGHNNETIKSYDQIVIKHHRDEYHEGGFDDGPAESMDVPDFFPEEWLDIRNQAVDKSSNIEG